MEHYQSTNPSGTDNGTLKNRKVKVIGLYGIPASGKTHLLNELKKILGEKDFSFYEGSEMIAELAPGGLAGFQELDEQQKNYWRSAAIDAIAEKCAASSRVGVVAGHFMFWAEDEAEGRAVYTPNDLSTFTHILYLDVPVGIIQKRCADDRERARPLSSVAHLVKWQQTEKTELSELCRHHNILFSLLSSTTTILERASELLRDFRRHGEDYNTTRVEKRLEEILIQHEHQLTTLLVMDADRTLAPDDTGALFWRHVAKVRGWTDHRLPLKSLFGGPLGYSYNAFRQATLLYEDTVSNEEYEEMCDRIASEVSMYPEFISLLGLVRKEEHIGIVVVSCGLLRVWEKVLDREGLSDTVKVIAGGRIADGFVVTAAVKASIVARLKDLYHMSVWVFGDSPLDLEMLREADQSIVVVGEESSRSKSMDGALSIAIDQYGFRARQVLLPGHVSPRLDVSRLPLVTLTEAEFIEPLLQRRQPPVLPIFLATEKNAAKLLATPMRDSAVKGPSLRKAHSRTGVYLATEFLTSIIGIEEYQVPHVLGHHTTGYRLLNESQTTIVALMRAGEPMASGISKVFPLAMFLHAKELEDIKASHLQGQARILLVDSVINSGQTTLEFVDAIRSIDRSISVVIVAGVVQARCISPNSAFYKALANFGNITLVGLRASETKFTGSGGTDTGNRLFNTTHLLRDE
ncbi:hypothetical protein BS50DRAFT_614720 [Corynespora cassiicola Philippines]|uniref:Phosphoribosyltransferase domain-containing protein n=1 Tax=Corynespora cassiicola Philippines TaxID=1448308 RepID=A0A2T2N1B0_CORCC|nr:hypothetical protein BS50DRAFT_614720 [Corynespora cassiicola Philippines]